MESIHVKARKLLTSEINIINRLQRMREIKLMLNHLVQKEDREAIRRNAQCIALDSAESGTDDLDGVSNVDLNTILDDQMSSRFERSNTPITRRSDSPPFKDSISRRSSERTKRVTFEDRISLEDNPKRIKSKLRYSRSSSKVIDSS